MKTVPVARIFVETNVGRVLTHALAYGAVVDFRSCQILAKAKAKAVKGTYLYFEVEKMKMPIAHAYQAVKDYDRNVLRSVGFGSNVGGVLN